MPFTTPQLLRAVDYAMPSISARDPIDQSARARPLLDYLLSKKESVTFAQGVYREKIRISRDSNYQNYFGRDQVTYNSRDPIRMTTWGHFNFHDGFGFDEDEMAGVGIILTDDKEAVATGAEVKILANKLKESRIALREGVLDALDIELHLDGTQNTRAVPGLDHLIDPTPATGVVGGFDSATSPWWQNNANMGIATANLLAEMEKSMRSATLFGGMMPDKIFVGAAFLDAYRAAIKAEGATQITFQAGKGGVALDGGVSDLTFRGIPLVWDPTFEQLDSLFGPYTFPWTKRAYFINSRTITFRPFTGRWMVERKPERLPDRYFHYWALTGAYGFTTNKRNANVVLSIA